MSFVMRLHLGTTTGVSLLTTVILFVFCSERDATAATDAGSAVEEAFDQAGRIIGVGWGDGYHACKNSSGHCVDDLPPSSHAAYQRKCAKQRARSCAQQDACATVYDYFDAGCDNACDADCRSGCGPRGCEGCSQGYCDSTEEFSPSNVQYLPLGKKSGQPRSQWRGALSDANAGESIRQKYPANPSEADEPVFRRFSATSTPGVISPVHPYERGRQQQSSPQNQSNEASLTRIYPTLVAPRRAKRLSGLNPANKPALLHVERRANQVLQDPITDPGDGTVSTEKNYSTMSEIEHRAANPVHSDMDALPARVIEAGSDVHRLPGISRPVQRENSKPMIEVANRRMHPIDNVIRQPDMQR